MQHRLGAGAVDFLAEADDKQRDQQKIGRQRWTETDRAQRQSCHDDAEQHEIHPPCANIGDDGILQQVVSGQDADTLDEHRKVESLWQPQATRTERRRFVTRRRQRPPIMAAKAA